MTQDEIQAVARAICASIGSLESDETDAVWPDWIGEAKAAIAALDAARGKAEPVAWMYIRRPEEWPPANPVVGLNQWKHDDPARPYWIETPLYAHPPADRVAQEDREAAARYWGNDNPPLELQREFARHRIAALELAAQVADRHDTGDCTREDMEARRIAEAIRNLKGSSNA